jgi:RNA polymerase sigma factor (sigma-70 family)
VAGVLLSDASDERLAELAHAGDERAFATIVERYRAPLLRSCLGYLPAAAAEDAVQQAFINAYRALSDPERPVPTMLRPWLYRVARNAALNVARDPQSGLDELPADLDGVRRPDEVVQGRERFRRVIGAVSALPPKQREVIVRHAVEGESHERIATDLGMTAGSIRQLAHRARQTVRAAAAVLIPSPLMRFLPVGADAAEVSSGAALAKVAVAVVVVGAAGGGAVEVARKDADKPAIAETRKSPPRKRAPEPPTRRAQVAPGPVVGGDAAQSGPSDGDGSSSGKGLSGRKRLSRSGSNSGSSGSGSSDSSGSGSSGSSGSGSSGSSGSGSSGSSDSGSSGSGSSGSGSDSSGSGSSGSSGSGASGSGSDSSGSGSGSSGSGSSDSSGSGSSGSGSGSSGSGSSGSGTSGSGSDSSGSGSSGSGSGSDHD